MMIWKGLKKVGEEMIEVATNIVKGNGFSAKFIFDKDTKPTAIMAPIYPYFPLHYFLDFWHEWVSDYSVNSGSSFITYLCNPLPDWVKGL